MKKSARGSIDSVAAALSDTAEDVWERSFEIAKPDKHRSRKGRAAKGATVLALLGGAGFILSKRREQAASVAKSAANKATPLAKSAAGKAAPLAKSAAGKAKSLRRSGR
jgi:hypothetical protein